MSDVMQIKCNWQTRPVLRWYELTKKERKEFDYLDSGDKQDSATFVRYRGWVYDLGEFSYIRPPVAPHPQRPGWEKFDGYHGDSFFSGVLVKYLHDEWHDDEVIMATYLC